MRNNFKINNCDAIIQSIGINIQKLAFGSKPTRNLSRIPA